MAIKYDKSTVIMESTDEYVDRMIELHPDNKEYWEKYRESCKEHEKFIKNNPCPSGYIWGFNPDIK